jgi:hypothetical protein
VQFVSSIRKLREVTTQEIRRSGSDRSHCSTATGLTCSGRRSPHRKQIQRLRADEWDYCVEHRRSGSSGSM